MTDTTTETWLCSSLNPTHKLLLRAQGCRFGRRVLVSTGWERRADGRFRVFLQWLLTSSLGNVGRQFPDVSWSVRLRLWWEMLWWDREVT